MPVTSFLPDIIAFEGNWNTFLNKTWSCFQNTILHSDIRFRGKRVVVDGRTDERGICEGFWHVTSAKVKETGERVPDIPRAERVVWIAPLIENSTSGEVRWWEDREKPRKVKHYIWAEPDDFVVILLEQRSVVALVTAFHVDLEWTRKDLQRKWNRSLK